MNLTDEARRIIARSPRLDPYTQAVNLLHDLDMPITQDTIQRAKSAILRAIAKPTATRGGARKNSGPKRVNWKCRTCGEIRTNAQYVRLAVCDVCADVDFEQVAPRKRARK